ncbi:phage replication protein, partial [Reticulomyxa filosa]
MFSPKKRKLNDLTTKEIRVEEQDELEKEMNEACEKLEKQELKREDLKRIFDRCLELMRGKQEKKEKEKENEPPEVKELELKEEALITDFDKIKGINIRAQLYIGIYPSYITIQRQNKKNKEKEKAIRIAYSDIMNIIVGNDFENNEIILHWKGDETITSLLIYFKDEREDKSEHTYEIEPYRQETKLPELMKGTIDSVFIDVISILGNNYIPILRPDRLYFPHSELMIKGCIQARNIRILPLQQGIFIEPKPILFLPSNHIISYSFPKDIFSVESLRFFQFTIFTDLPDPKSDNDITQSFTITV